MLNSMLTLARGNGTQIYNPPTYTIHFSSFSVHAQHVLVIRDMFQHVPTSYGYGYKVRLGQGYGQTLKTCLLQFQYDTEEHCGCCFLNVFNI